MPATTSSRWIHDIHWRPLPRRPAWSCRTLCTSSGRAPPSGPKTTPRRRQHTRAPLSAPRCALRLPVLGHPSQEAPPRGAVLVQFPFAAVAVDADARGAHQGERTVAGKGGHQVAGWLRYGCRGSGLWSSRSSGRRWVHGEVHRGVTPGQRLPPGSRAVGIATETVISGTGGGRRSCSRTSRWTWCPPWTRYGTTRRAHEPGPSGDENLHCGAPCAGVSPARLVPETGAAGRAPPPGGGSMPIRWLACPLVRPSGASMPRARRIWSCFSDAGARRQRVLASTKPRASGRCSRTNASACPTARVGVRARASRELDQD